MPDGLRAALPDTRVRLLVRGAVQGAGFRPFAFRLAQELGISGFVRNTADGVEIEAEGWPEQLAAFECRLGRESPVPANGLTIASGPVPPRGERGFAIATSASGAASAVLPMPDRAICPACRADIAGPGRYHGYAFTSCTVCGPRFSILQALPYDRARTAMAGFPLCVDCNHAYHDPNDRRFHAEAQACPRCGPQLTLRDSSGALAEGTAAIARAAGLLRNGGILAVKGIGGFHLLANAGDGAAIRTLRQRKRRPTQPFAVMFPSMAAAEAWCEMSPEERAALLSPAAPIVLLRRNAGCAADEVTAPGNPRLGALLPYTPLHHLLMETLAFPVIATSANLSGAPVLIGDGNELDTLADAVLTHNRPVLRPVEDGVVQFVNGRQVTLRLGRGAAPLAVPLAAPAPPLLALGGHLKNAPGIALGASALLGPQLGDLDHPDTLQAHRALAAGLCRMHGVTPHAVVCDAHPDDIAEARAHRLPVIAVQHHLAHVAAAIAEGNLNGKVLGIAWDGAGYGPDGTIWGGEFLSVDGATWRRVAHLRTFPLPGGDAAAREPARAATGLLAELFGGQAWPEGVAARLAETRLPALLALCRPGTATPRTSSAGRLLDAASALLGLCRRNSFEGEAAIALEHCATGSGEPYPFALTGTDPIVLDWGPAIHALLNDLAAGEATANIATRFYRGLIAGAAEVARRAGIASVVLTGGCLQSPLLAAGLTEALTIAGLHPYIPSAVPPGDGGLALGQLEWARRLLAAG